jgi:hypothetical protein
MTLMLCAGSAVCAQDAPATPSQADKPATQAEPAVDTSAAKDQAAPAKGKKRAADRLDLDTTTVTGNRELPKVLYIVPWKKADIGDLPGQPFNTLLDEALTPVDRDVFRREVTYYDAVSAGHDAGSAAPAGLTPAGKAQ